MTEIPSPRLAETYAEVEDALLSRWPETRLEPSLDRIRAFTELLGDPQRSFPVIHLTGTNGKTSTSRMIDALLRGLELRTGRFTSPHVERMSERISLDGEPLDDEQFVQAFNDVAPYTHLVDAAQEHPLSFFETIVAMAYAAFADAPVEVAVVEVGMGGSWDATNVADAAVAVVLPVAVDHARYLGETPAAIAAEKAGIIKPGSVAVLAGQSPEVAEVLLRRAVEVDALVVREGTEFGVVSRVPGVGGQLLSLQGLRATYDDVFLPLHGAHQAQNAAVALAAVESFAGSQPLDADIVRTDDERDLHVLTGGVRERPWLCLKGDALLFHLRRRRIEIGKCEAEVIDRAPLCGCQVCAFVGLVDQQPDSAIAQSVDAALEPVCGAAEYVLVPLQRGLGVVRLEMNVVKPERLLVFNDLDACAPRVLDEAQLEEARHLSHRRRDLHPCRLEGAHLGGEIGEGESDVIDARPFAAGIGFPVGEDQLRRADLTRIWPVHRRAADVRDVPLDCLGHIRGGKVHVVIIGGVSGARQRHEHGGHRGKTEKTFHDVGSGFMASYNLTQSACAHRQSSSAS